MKINPERVDLVRRRLGLSKIEFASRLKVDRKTIQRFESGENELSQDTLDALVAVSGYPQTFFYKGFPETPSPDAVSFRSLRSLTARPRDAAIAAATIAFELDDWVQERFDFPAHDLVQMKDFSPQDAALSLRSRWGIGVRPIANMINVLEAHGVRVFSLSEETRHLDAYSFWRDERPYVFLNTCKTAEHSRFDAAHELGHLVLHRHGGPAHRSAEDEANAFASEFLIPSPDLEANVRVIWSVDDLIRAKKRWGVSAAALNYALNHRRFKIVSDWSYRGFCIELNRIGRGVEPEPMQPESSQIWAKVLTALWREGVSLSRIATDLAVPERELSNLLFKIASTPKLPEPAVRASLRLAC
jgi:Zn-dependent peptidase ImmA (M78 family)/DNA-binding XRE family transcriptional regulator